MFAVFGENMLDPIDSSATNTEILAWKASYKTKNCFNKLFKPIDKNDPNITYMSKILAKLWPTGQVNHGRVAFAIAICQTILNPENEKLTICEETLTNKIQRNLVNENFNISNYLKFCNLFLFLIYIEKT